MDELLTRPDFPRVRRFTPAYSKPQINADTEGVVPPTVFPFRVNVPLGLNRFQGHVLSAFI